MLDEIIIRRRLLLVNLIIGVGCALFLWLNEFFCPNYSAEQRADYQDSNESYTTAPPPWLVTSTVLPKDIKVDGDISSRCQALPPKNQGEALLSATPLTGKKDELPLHCQILSRLNDEREALSLPELSEMKEYVLFAQKLAQALSDGSLPFGDFNSSGNALANREFNDRENTFVLKATKYPAAGNYLVDELTQGLNNPLLKDIGIKDAGIGVLKKGNDVIAVLYLAKTAFTYDKPFPKAGDIKLGATLNAENDPKSLIQIRSTHLKRGWISAVNKTETIRELQLNENKLSITEEAPESGWTRIEFLVDGLPLNRGRSLLPREVK